MILGLTPLVWFHTLLSIVALLAGIPVLRGLLHGQTTTRWTMTFLITAVLTSATGYILPAAMILPSHIVGAVALFVLAVVLVAYYAFHLAGIWRLTYVTGLVCSQFLLTFVLVAQLFAKVPPLHALAPTGSEPAFGIAQVIVLALFVWLGFAALRAARRSALQPV